MVLSEVEYVIFNIIIQHHRYPEGLHKMAALKAKNHPDTVLAVFYKC